MENCSHDTKTFQSFPAFIKTFICNNDGFQTSAMEGLLDDLLQNPLAYQKRLAII